MQLSATHVAHSVAFVSVKKHALKNINYENKL